jgi:predicted ATP-grasp superfamily ATP-dependent carboligase
LQDYDKITPELLPLILKWNETPLGTRVPFKTQVIENSDSLQSIENLPDNFHNYLILQQLVIGTDLSYAGYFQDNQEVLGCVTEKRRQYPIWGGLGSYVADYAGPAHDECLNAGRALAKKLDVSGFLEVEFKYDKHGNLYLIEANPRIWGWAKFLKLKCENFSDILLDPHITPIINPNDCKWFSLLRDGKAVWSLVKTDKIIRVMRGVIDSYRGEKIFDVFEPGDLRPFVYQFFKGIKRGTLPIH